MLTNIANNWRLKQNAKEIRKETWVFEELSKEMERILPTPNSMEVLLKHLYDYTYMQVFLNQKPLEQIFFQVINEQVYQRYSKDSLWDTHKITIDHNGFLYEFHYEFKKLPRWNWAGHNGVSLQKDGLNYAQIFLKSKESIPLLKEKQTVQQSFNFKEDVPKNVQENVCEVFSWLETLKEKAQCEQEEIQKKKQKEKEQQEKKRKDILESL